MANFTKGPWKAHRNESFSYSIGTDYAHDRGHDCNVIREVRCEANAFLVAAAPEMFDALQTLMQLDPPAPFPPSDERHKEWFAFWAKAQAALRKVTRG